MEFHLIDLVSQGAAVERILKGKPKEYWIEWLLERGKVTMMKREDPSWPETYFFESMNGLECTFSIIDYEFHFVGDHYYFKSRKDV